MIWLICQYLPVELFRLHQPTMLMVVDCQLHGGIDRKNLRHTEAYMRPLCDGKALSLFSCISHPHIADKSYRTMRTVSFILVLGFAASALCAAPRGITRVLRTFDFEE